MSFADENPRIESWVRCFVSLTIILFACSTQSAAQIGGGSLVGYVVDPSGAAIIGANVTAINVDTSVRRAVQTNVEGYYEYPLLPAGNYQLEAEADGFRRGTTAVFELNSGTRPRLDLNLELGAVAESVEVVGSAPIVNTTTTELGVVMDKRKLESLPLNGRDFQQLVGLQVGVLSDPPSTAGGRGGMEFHGSSSWGNNLMLDGVDMTFGENTGTASDQSGGAGNSGTLINTVSVEAIEEFKVSGSAFSAEYGRSTGGILNITTKGGTNDFHGTLFEFFRNDKLDANSFFSNQSDLDKPPLRWNQFGGNIGGPLKRNKAFFFANYEGAIVRRNQQITGNVATPNLISKLTPELRSLYEALSPTDYEATSDPDIGFHRRNDRASNDEHTFLTRGDVDFTKHRLSARYSYNHQNYWTPKLIDLPRVFPTRFHNAVVQDTSTITPLLFNELRLGFNRMDLNRNEPGSEVYPAWAIVGGGGPSVNVGSFIHYLTTTYTVSDNLSMVRGAHTVKAGFEIRFVRSSRGQGGRSRHRYNNRADLIADTPSRVSVLFEGGKDLDTTNYGFFIQDDWRLSPRLQLNMGLRYEYNSPLKGGYNISSSDPFGPFINAGENMYVEDRNNFAPRLGLAWDILGNQKMVVRAGGGIGYMPQLPIFFYDMAFIHPLLPFIVDFRPADVSGGNIAYPISQEFIDGVAQDPSLLPEGLVPSRSIVDYNRRDSYAGQWNLSFQTAVNPKLAVQASYVGSRSLKITTPRTLNLVDPETGARPRPEFGDINILENIANISYHSLQLSANQRLTHGLTFDAYYTYGKALGYGTPDSTLAFSNDYLQDPYNIAGSYGPKAGDIRHRFVGVLSYEIPTRGLASEGAAKAILGGWTVQGITTWRSGLPVNIYAGTDLRGNGVTDGQRPDLVGGVDPYIKDADALMWLNPQAFDITTPAQEQRFGNLGYNALRGPSGFSLDASLHKSFAPFEGHRLTFRFEMFNALNHKVLSEPVDSVSNVNFGKIISASEGRNIQIGLKYQF